VETSVLGLGTVKFGRNEKVKYPRPFDLPDDESIYRLLKSASESGINLIDTAPAYGSSEVRLGEAMDRFGWFGSRSSWVVSTKAGEEFSDGASRYCFQPDHLQMSVHRSCSRLKTDYLDLVLLHSDPEERCLLESSEAMETLSRLRDQGVVRMIGASCYTVAGAGKAVQSGADVLMLTVNQQETCFIPLLSDFTSPEIGILIKKPFGSGFLSQTPDAAGGAIRFVFEHTPGDRTSVIVGTLNPDHLKQHCNTAEQFYG
jgi:aryl-alcohol dehydrogenase-like predicted oxidoreductase